MPGSMSVGFIAYSRFRESELFKARSTTLLCINPQVYLASSERYRSNCANVRYSLFILWTEARSLLNQQALQQLSSWTSNRSAWQHTQHTILRTVEMRFVERRSHWSWTETHSIAGATEGGALIYTAVDEG
jgi:hypothetical protein